MAEKILVVEDELTLQETLVYNLKHQGYMLETASDGPAALDVARRSHPDLIILDIMLPGIDGFEVCRILRQEMSTPVLMLTARDDEIDRVVGLEVGADDYLTKPFDIKELQVRIKNLIMIRKRLQDKFSKMVYPAPDSKDQPEEKILSSIDEKFMSKVAEVIEEHISDEDFSIEEFGSEVGMSRTQLHRKLKALTGKSASLYLRSVRLAKALIMIKANKGNISEISFNVGFSSPAYFTKCFKKEFGYPPSDLTNH